MPLLTDRTEYVHLGFTQIQEWIIVSHAVSVALLVQQLGILSEIHE